MPGVRPVMQKLDRPLRLGVLISGGGTTLDNFLRCRDAGTLEIEVPIVIASRPDCRGVAKSRAAGLRCDVVARKEFASVESFSAEIFARCREAQVDLVTLAGFLSLIRIPDDFQYRVMNIHPALIPAFSGKGFYGHHVHEAALAKGVKVAGCTVHFADNQYDHGPIIAQRCVSVEEDDTPDTLAQRVFEAECIAYPEALRLWSAGRLEIEGQRVHILPAEESPRS